MPLLQPGAWGLASSFPRRQLAAAAGIWATGKSEKHGVNLTVNLADLEKCIEAGSSLGGERKDVNSELQYEAAPAEALSLTVRPLVGEEFSVQVLQHSSILEVKQQVEQQTGLLPEQQRLIYAGQVLDEQQTLQHYKIGAQHTVQLAPRAGAISRAGSSSGSSAPAAANLQTAASDGAADASDVLVVSTVAQLRQDVAHGAPQLALYVLVA
eukprot:GHRQ01009624.1.p1 GENE.GHRQ01009624.1~~GHRQ01009624.1.p1  ORF type:complete len:211 (+),score=110.58 GHRQ01009624.1:266-898(+)